jgi:hypothetical protein
MLAALSMSSTISMRTFLPRRAAPIRRDIS